MSASHREMLRRLSLVRPKEIRGMLVPVLFDLLQNQNCDNKPTPR